MCLAFSPDGTTLATGSGDNSIKLWNLASFQEVTTLRDHKDGVTCLVFSPDSRTLASGSLDKTVRLWPAASFQETDPLPVIALAGDHAVMLQWRPLSWAVGYNVYRRSGVQEASAPERLTRLTSRPVTGTFYSDQSPGLVNGRPLTYAVAPLFVGPGGKSMEAPPVTLRAAPVLAPSGFMGSSINGGDRTGSVFFQPEALPRSPPASRAGYPPKVGGGPGRSRWALPERLKPLEPFSQPLAIGAPDPAQRQVDRIRVAGG